MSFKSQLLSLVKEAHKYQYADVNDTIKDIGRKKPTLYFTKLQWGLILFSAIIACLMRDGFSDSFAGYVVSGLSLFAGLFFSFILMLINKFQKIDFEPYKRSNDAGLMPLGIRLKNYYKKATTLSFYIILLSLLSVFLLSLSLFNFTLGEASCLKEEATISRFITTTAGFIRVLYKGTTVYFLLDFLWITLYLIASFYDYAGSEYDKVTLK